jgi:tetratricopeptide (TPR) repeat protein
LVARVAVAVVAVLVLGWLVVLERDRRLEARASETSARIIQPGNFERSESDFEAARLLNPDVNPDLKRAYLYLGAGRVEQAAGVIEDVVRREPDNLAAWAALYTISRERDPAAARRALEARRRLDPLNAP